MAAHRYWRVVNPEARGIGGLEISEFHLLDGSGVRIDGSATLTGSVAPSTGALANLKDDDTSTAASWPASALRSLVLNWDFGGSPQDVSDIRVGAADSTATMLYSVRLQSSDDAATWAEELQVFSITYPGARTKTGSEKLAFTPYDISPNTRLSADKQTITYGGAASGSARGVLYRSSGVYQLEFQGTGSFSGATVAVGIATSAVDLNLVLGASATGYSVAYRNDGAKALTGSQTSYGATYAAGDVIGVICDFTAGTVTFYKNGVSQGAIAAALAGKTVSPAAGVAGSGFTLTMRTSGFTYPVAGATAWDTRQNIKTDAFGKVSGVSPAQVVTAAGVSVFRGTGIALPKTRRDINWTMLGQGIGRLKGTTKDKGTPNVPVSERVRLYRQKDGLLMREMWSTPGTGVYSFDYIDEQDTYFVVSFDHDLNFRAVIADNLSLANGGVELIA